MKHAYHVVLAGDELELAARAANEAMKMAHGIVPGTLSLSREMLVPPGASLPRMMLTAEVEDECSDDATCIRKAGLTP